MYAYGCWAWRLLAHRDGDGVGGFDEVNIGCEISWGWGSNGMAPTVGPEVGRAGRVP